MRTAPGAVAAPSAGRWGWRRAIKKAAGNAAIQKGTNASKLLASPAAPPSPGGQHCRGRRLRTAKKMGLFPKHPPFDASSPHRRGQQQGDGRNTYQSSPQRQNNAAVRQPRKSRGPTLCSLAAFTPYWGDLMFARTHHLRHRHKRPLGRGALRPPKGR